MDFLTFFMVMFGLMLFSTYRVFTGAPLSQTVTLLWVFKLPWQWADVSFVAPWIGQFAFGVFRRYAHLDGAGPFDNGIVPAPVVVRILPDGNHDPGNLQIKERKEGKGIWKNRQRK